MKNFKEFLSEAPIDFESEEEKESLLKHPPGKYNSEKFSETFIKKYRILGEGSSRIAFQADINANLFKASDLKKLETNPEGSVQTAIKLGFNKKGMMQNRVELEIWNRVKSMPGAKYLCPIIDWSGNPKYKNDIYYEINSDLVTKNGNKTAPFWIQMPLVTMYSWGSIEFNAIIKNEFGINEFPEARDEDRIYKFYKRYKEITAKQYKNSMDFIKIVKMYNLTDFHGGNIGVYKGRPVVLDYGFSDETERVYWGDFQNSLNVTINDEGEVEISW